MTVKELIEELKKEDESAIVMCRGIWDGTYSQADSYGIKLRHSTHKPYIGRVLIDTK